MSAKKSSRRDRFKAHVAVEKANRERREFQERFAQQLTALQEQGKVKVRVNKPVK